MGRIMRMRPQADQPRNIWLVADIIWSAAVMTLEFIS